MAHVRVPSGKDNADFNARSHLHWHEIHTFLLRNLIEYHETNTNNIIMSLCMTKPTIWVSDQVQHKPACTVTEETQNLENLGISRGGNVLSV